MRFHKSFYVKSSSHLKRMGFLKFTNLAHVWGKRECFTFPVNSTLPISALKWFQITCKFLFPITWTSETSAVTTTGQYFYTISSQWPCHTGHLRVSPLTFIAYIFLCCYLQGKNLSHNFSSAVHKQKCLQPTYHLPAVLQRSERCLSTFCTRGGGLHA